MRFRVLTLVLVVTAAILLLTEEGELSIDDPVRKHIPELPDYGARLTIRHMLNHTLQISVNPLPAPESAFPPSFASE